MLQDAGFSWSNMLAMVMQMLFNPIGNQQVGPNKSDSIDTDQVNQLLKFVNHKTAFSQEEQSGSITSEDAKKATSLFSLLLYYVTCSIYDRNRI